MSRVGDEDRKGGTDRDRQTPPTHKERKEYIGRERRERKKEQEKQGQGRERERISEKLCFI